MRWQNLALDADEPAPGLPAPLFAQGAVVRRFDTPHFRGITFYEVRARSIINRVPEASRVPFRWTINPYRGCSHACSYCMVGDTQVLMADGRTKHLADLRVGDQIVGTAREGAYRRYVPTEVLAHWKTLKPAYRVTLEDGTQLVASGDHRFLTDRGWKHVTGTTSGQGQRPYLTTNNKLMGIGDFGQPQTTTGQSAITRKRTFLGRAVKSCAKLRVASVEQLAIELPMYDITTGTGDFIANGVISHNCFARKTHTYLDLDAGRDFDTNIVVKVNAEELLRKELARPKWTGEHIAMGTNVDCYQRAEGRYQLMRGILSALRDAANPYSILTKGALILRDLDLLQESAERTDVSTNVSVGFVDRDMWRSVESGTPSPQRRLEVCHELNAGGIPCGVLMAPILPYLTDSPAQLEATVKAIAESGATHISPIVLHLRPGAREWFFAWLGEHHPALVPRYEDLYRRGAYAPKKFQQHISELVHEFARKHRVGATTPGRSRRVPPIVEPSEQQLSLL